MAPALTIPVVDLDNENEKQLLFSAKSRGYFYVSRSSSFGTIPDQTCFESLARQLFNLSLQNKLNCGSAYIRSTHLHEVPLKKEFLSITTESDTTSLYKSILLRDILDICHQLSVRIAHLLDLPSGSSSSSLDTLQFGHYSSLNAPLIVNANETPLVEFHLFSTCELERLDSLSHEWTSIELSMHSNDYILVTLPNVIHRYSPIESSSNLKNYTINYFCYHAVERPLRRTYFLSLTQNTFLRYFTFFYLYVMQGIPAGFSSTALANYLTAEGEQSSTIGTFVSLSGLPWALQFVWGPLIDRFQSSPMGRRRPWVIGSQICAFIASLGLLFVGNPPTQYIKTLVIAFFVHSIFASVQDASVDAQAITIIPLSERGRINGFMRGGFLVGSAVGAAGLSWILRNRGYLPAALINSSFLLMFTLVTFFIKEKSHDVLFPCSRPSSSANRAPHPSSNHSITWLFKELFKGLLSSESLRLFIPIVIVYASQSAFIRAYNIHLIKELGWKDTSVSILSGGWGTLIVVGVALTGGWLADRIGARRLLIIVMFFHACYMFTVNLIEMYWRQRPVATAVLILWNMMDPTLSTASMPVLMSLCRSHVEGSQFTTYMSMINLCDLVGAFVSGHLQSYFRASVIGLGCAVLIVCALVVASVGIWYDRRRMITSTTKIVCDKTRNLSQTSATRAYLTGCWPWRTLVKHHRGAFNVND